MALSEEQRQKHLKRIARLRLMDDDFLSICMAGNIKGAQLIVRIILNDNTIRVKRVETQKEYKNLSEHSFCFDVYAEDAEGKNIEVEVQRKSAGAAPERAACHSGLLDANSMPKNEQDYTKKAETFTIFITEHDVLKGNLPIYHIDRRIAELDGKTFGDKSHIIYVNGAYPRNESTPLGRLVHDFFCTEPDDMHYEELAERARYFKKDSKGVDTMCEIWEEVLQEGLERGREQGREQGRAEEQLSSIRNLMDTLQMTAQQAMNALKIPEEKQKIYSEHL